MAGRLCRVLASWKWVLAYTALLLLSLNQTRRFLDWLEDRNLAGLQAVFLLFAGIGCFFLLLRHIYRTRGGFTLSTGLRLVGYLSLYLCCMFLATDLTVDRIHFVEYGILGLLCFHAVRPGHGQLRRAAHAMVAVFAVGFLDETVQGLLASRPYQDEDLLFQGQRGPMTVSYLNRLVKGWCKQINLKGNYGSHSLRKTWGYHQRKTFSVDIPTLMTCFNHSTQRQTLDYLCIQPEEVQAVYMNEL